MKQRRTPAVFSAATSEAPPQASEAVLPWATVPGGVVDGGEIVILAIKPSMWQPVFDSAAWLVTCCLLVAVLTWFYAPLPGLSLTSTAQLVLLIGFARLALAAVRWIPTWHLLTNRRILTTRGVRMPRVASLALTDIRNTYLRSSSGERLAGLGTITFIPGRARERAHVWRCINDPQDVHDKIRRAIEHAIDHQGPL